jgi:hypothetical protein
MTFYSKDQAVVGILRQTQEVLNRDGWIQGNLHSPEGHCLVGSIHVASAELEVNYKDTEAAQLVLRNTLTHLVGQHSGIGQWNDLKTTKREDVDRLIAESIGRVEYYAGD